MKVTRIIPLLALLSLAACKKEYDKVSHTVTVSRPTVTYAGVSIDGDNASTDHYYLETITADQTVFVTVPVGAIVPPVTAYDSVLKTGIGVDIIRDGHLNTAVPGLYVYDFRTKLNQNGYGTRVRYYIGVSNVSGAVDLSGLYRGVIGASTDTLDDIAVDPLDRAMYIISDPVADRSQIGAVFVQTSDSTIDIGSQPTDLGAQSYGDISGTDGRVRKVSGDTVISYKLVNPTINSSFGNSTFTLIKE
jgi:hypothetical protein